VAKPRLVYLIGQFPAINHGYLLAEVRELRRLGFDVPVISVSPPDRPSAQLSSIEREEAAQTYYVKSLPPGHSALLNLVEFLRSPLRYLNGLAFALHLAGFHPEKRSYYLAYFAEAVLVGRRMRKLGISHVHASFSATVALIAAKVFLISWSFGVYGYGELHNPTASHLRGRIASAKFVRSISRFGRDQLMFACGGDDVPKLFYSPLGIDVAEFAPRAIQTANAVPRLLCVGRLSPEKNQALLLESLAQLKSQGRAVQLHLIGDGPDRQRLENYANELGISSSVVFEGWLQQEQLMTRYHSADIFVLSSLAEGIPMVLMEAMALEKPCVAPRIAGIPELIEHGIDGLLFAAADRDDLTQCLSNLLQSPDARRQMGKRAREKVLRDYDVTRNTARFAGLLEQQLPPPRA